jgi:hypothetical protein
MKDSSLRSTLYSGLIREMAEPIDPTRFYCSHGNQWHECEECEASLGGGRIVYAGEIE